jgi:phosphoserine phosphatase
MTDHFALTDAEFEQQFAGAELDPALFNHEAHLRLAWIHIRKYGEAQAITNICSQLVNFVTRLDALSKYNKTLTIAAIKAVNHFIKRSNADSFQEFISEFPRLKHNFRELIASHYSIDVFQSPQAKQTYLQPDLLAF